MTGKWQFVDTNVLLYAHDKTAGAKHEMARDLIEELWGSRKGRLSVQVLQEFYVNVTRKIPKPLDTTAAKAIVADLARWHVHTPGVDDILAAVSIHESASISFWDAMIVRSAVEMSCEILHSEDLSHGQRYCGILVLNPFRVG